MVRILKDKRGQFVSAITIVVSLFLFGLVAYLALFIGRELDAADFTESQAANDSLASGISFFESLDSLFLWVFILFGFVVMGSAFFLRTHPIFLFIGGLIIVIFTLIVAAGFSDAFVEIENSSDFNTVKDDFGIMNHIWENMPTYILVIFGIMIVALFAKGILSEGGA